jgi:hypothetical protein
MGLIVVDDAMIRGPDRPLRKDFEIGVGRRGSIPRIVT